MTDWHALAVARKLDIPLQQIEKIAPTLDALEEAFLPLPDKLPRAYAEWE